MITGIVIALPEELATLTQKRIVPGSCVLVAENCLVTLSGVGADNARRAAQLLLKEGAKRLLSWGCAGALDTHLHPGDLYLPERFLAADDAHFAADEHWRQQAFIAIEEYFRLSHLGGGVLVESPHIVATAPEKAELFQRSGAQLVDMESCAIAAVAAEAGVPFMAIRAVADPVNFDLPAVVGDALKENGQISMMKLLFGLLRHPGQLPRLLCMAGHFHAAKKSLALAAEALHAITCFDNALPG